MNDDIYFDESNKLDQPNSKYPCYGVSGTISSTASNDSGVFEWGR